MIKDENRAGIRAAQYIRMSTEHQQYSTENQADVIREYAARRGYEIVRTFADAGKSGLNIQGRQSLQQLISDVQNGRADFKTILAYDISRWGRFQDADESAYYEYICRRAGINVEYCAEQFENDGSPTATIIKSVKRAMAGEYSRELSGKVFKGQCKLIELGYRQGGPAGYGLRRMLVSMTGEAKGILKRGEHKSLQTDRVVLVPGPPAETDVVRLMYQWFTENAWGESRIADELNRNGVINSELERPWTVNMVHQVLTNEKYIGNNVYNRQSFKLKKVRVRNAPEMWVRRDQAFQPIVDPALFYMARGIMVERCRRFTDVELLEKLKALLSAHGTLTAALIDADASVPSTATYQHRFGSLVAAYGRVGFDPRRDYRYVEINRRLRALTSGFEDQVVRKLEAGGGHVLREPDTGRLLINGEYTADIRFVRSSGKRDAALEWSIALDPATEADICIVARMNADNTGPADFFFLPRIGLRTPLKRLREYNGAEIDTFRYDAIDPFISLAARTTVEVAA